MCSTMCSLSEMNRDVAAMCTGICVLILVSLVAHALAKTSHTRYRMSD
jgi:hypothetical protein